MAKNRDLGDGTTTTKISNNKKGDRFLFVIGIDNYLHFNKLSNAVKDAKDFIEVMTSKYRFSKDQGRLFTLFDTDANKENIFQVFEELINKVTDEDNLIIYYSGHGHYIKSTDLGYWIPVEANPNKTVQYLDNLNLINFIRSIKSKHTLLISDSCFSGSLFATHRSAFTDRINSMKSRWGIVSGRLEVVADGAPGQNSPFSSYLLKFLKENKEPGLAVSTIAERVKVAVANNSRQLPQASPLRDVGDEGGEMVLYLDGNEPVDEAPDTIPEKKTPVNQPERSVEMTPDTVDHNNFKSKVITCITDGDISGALDILMKFMPEENSVILIASQWNRLKKEVMSGTVDDKRLELRSNQISSSLLSLIR